MLELAVTFFLIFGSQRALAKDCVHKIKKDTIKVEWTGYKTTQKVGVTGKFLKIDVVEEKPGKDILSSVKNIKFKIDGLKFDAGNEARNKNLSAHFFKKFAEKAKMNGEIKDIGSGKLTLNLIANGVRANLPMSYDINGRMFKAKGSMEVSDFALENALASLSKACFGLHKGSDGKSKTWPTVGIMASAEFKKVCK